jgi:hypothetical protein
VGFIFLSPGIFENWKTFLFRSSCTAWRWTPIRTVFMPPSSKRTVARWLVYWFTSHCYQAIPVGELAMLLMPILMMECRKEFRAAIQNSPERELPELATPESAVPRNEDIAK